jgi:hypothetical protein
MMSDGLLTTMSVGSTLTGEPAAGAKYKPFSASAPAILSFVPAVLMSRPGVSLSLTVPLFASVTEVMIVPVMTAATFLT